MSEKENPGSRLPELLKQIPTNLLLGELDRRAKADLARPENQTAADDLGDIRMGVRRLVATVIDRDQALEVKKYFNKILNSQGLLTITQEDLIRAGVANGALRDFSTNYSPAYFSSYEWKICSNPQMQLRKANILNRDCYVYKLGAELQIVYDFPPEKVLELKVKQYLYAKFGNLAAMQEKGKEWGIFPFNANNRSAWEIPEQEKASFERALEEV